MPYPLKAGLAATASIATMAYTCYGTPAQGDSNPNSSRSGQGPRLIKKEDIHTETVKHMYMWKNWPIANIRNNPFTTVCYQDFKTDRLVTLQSIMSSEAGHFIPFSFLNMPCSVPCFWLICKVFRSMFSTLVMYVHNIFMYKVHVTKVGIRKPNLWKPDFLKIGLKIGQFVWFLNSLD